MWHFCQFVRLLIIDTFVAKLAQSLSHDSKCPTFPMSMKTLMNKADRNSNMTAR